jgi:histidyl-tRNA synthetase
VILPSIWEQQTFIDKAGPEVLGQMYTFKDKGGRDICLIPEATAIVQKTFKESWDKMMKKPVRVFYVQRCYRYERPQAGRYREFTQLGVECLGGDRDQNREEVIQLLRKCLDLFDVSYKLNVGVKRGLDYYVETGFEAEVETLGAQKQIAGGGAYDCGVGWAIGVDRLLLSY